MSSSPEPGAQAAPAPTPPAPDPHGVAKAVGTLVVFVISLVVGTYFVLNPNPLVAGIAFGIVGGIAHEIAQSGGKVIIPTTEPGGDLFLGSLAGAALGVVAGILSLHGVSLVNQTPDSMINIVVTSLSAGLGLKGIADVDPTQTKPQTPAQNL